MTYLEAVTLGVVTITPENKLDVVGKLNKELLVFGLTIVVPIEKGSQYVLLNKIDRVLSHGPITHILNYVKTYIGIEGNYLHG